MKFFTSFEGHDQSKSLAQLILIKLILFFYYFLNYQINLVTYNNSNDKGFRLAGLLRVISQIHYH